MTVTPQTSVRTDGPSAEGAVSLSLFCVLELAETTDALRPASVGHWWCDLYSRQG